MKRVNIQITSRQAYETPSSARVVEMFRQAIMEQFITPIFGENNDLITNVSYSGFSTLDGYTALGVDFDLGGELLFRIHFIPTVSPNKTSNCVVNFEIVDKNNSALKNFLCRAQGILSVRTDMSSAENYTNYTLSGTIDYLSDGTELKAIWVPNDSNGSIVFDTVDMISDNSKQNVAIIISTSGAKLYKIDTALSHSISETSGFSVADKVYHEKVYILDDSNIIALADNIEKMCNNTLGTNAFATGSYKKLIDVDGVRYRQLGGPYWIEDKD